MKERYFQLLDICLYGLAFTLPLSIAISSIFYFAALGFYILGAGWSLRERPPVWGPVEKSFALFFAVSFISGIFGASFKKGMDALGSDLYFLMVVLLLALVTDESKRLRLLHLFLWGSLVSSVYGLIQYAIGVNELDEVFLNVPVFLKNAPKGVLEELTMINGRVVGTRSHPLTYAEGLLFPLGYAMIQLFIRPKAKAWPLAFVGLSAAIVVSQSRGPWLAAIAMGLVLLAFVPIRRLFFRGWVFALPILFILFGSHFRDRAASITNLHHGSNSERLRMWLAGLEMTKDHPVLGIGTGTMKRVAPKYQSASDLRWGAWGHLHNNFVHMLAERGIIGLSSFLFFLFLVTKSFWDRLSKAHIFDDPRQVYPLFGILSLAAFLVSGLTETNYNDTEVLMTFYFALGLALKTGILPPQTD